MVRIPTFQTWNRIYLLAWVEQRPADMVMNMDQLGALKIMDDPEAVFQEGWLLCDVGEYERGLPYLQRAVAAGYFVAPTLAPEPAVRRPARPARVPGPPDPRRGRARPRPGRVPRGRRRTAPGLLT